tara:strand:- start:428 stop:967 length:540 start_codon:yes stop_codon:yes gene_type:complete
MDKSEIKKVILEEMFAALLEKDFNKELEAFKQSLSKYLMPMTRRNPTEAQRIFSNALEKWKEKNIPGEPEEIEDEESLEAVSDDPLQKQISWVVQNVFIPAKFDKVLDKALLDFAKKERGDFGTVGVKRLVSKYIPALKKIKKDIQKLMSGMVKESALDNLSPATLEMVTKTYELFNRK